MENVVCLQSVKLMMLLLGAESSILVPHSLIHSVHPSQAASGNGSAVYIYSWGNILVAVTEQAILSVWRRLIGVRLNERRGDDMFYRCLRLDASDCGTWDR